VNSEGHGTTGRVIRRPWDCDPEFNLIHAKNKTAIRAEFGNLRGQGVISGFDPKWATTVSMGRRGLSSSGMTTSMPTVYKSLTGTKRVLPVVLEAAPGHPNAGWHHGFFFFFLKTAPSVLEPIFGGTIGWAPKFSKTKNCSSSRDYQGRQRIQNKKVPPRAGSY